MDIKGQNIHLPDRQLSRPSLYMHSAADEGASPASASILGALDPIRTGRNRGRWVMAVFLIGVVGLGWAISQGKLTTQTESGEPLAENGLAAKVKETGESKAELAVPVIAAASQPLQETNQAPSSLTAPANIINEPVVAGAPEGVAPSAKLATSAQQQLSAPLLQEPTDVANATLPTLAVADNSKSALQVQASEAHAVRQSNGSTPAHVQAAGPGKQAKAPSRTAPASKPSKDGDVELIAALLNRVAAKPEPTKTATSTKENLNEKRARSAAVKRDKKTPINREQTARVGNEATVAQLKRCNSMGFFEAELCRFRTCNGRWGTDPGCPDTEQASAYHP